MTKQPFHSFYKAGGVKLIKFKNKNIPESNQEVKRSCGTRGIRNTIHERFTKN